MDHPIPMPRFRQRIVARRGSEFVAVAAAEAAYFYSDDKLTFLVARDGQRYLVDAPLADLEPALDPQDFFRLNRQYLVRAAAIGCFRPIGKGKLLVELLPRARGEIIVSQEKATPFRLWLEQ
jgi:DNA-binding LytR/AlgR family response regulator